MKHNTVGDIKKMLEEFDDDLPVVVVADHGQVYFKACDPDIGYVEDFEEWMMEGLAEEDADDYEDSVKVVVISGG